MKRFFQVVLILGLGPILGCQQSSPAPRAERHETPTEQTQATERTSHYRATKPEVSFETEHDGRFAEFVSRTAGEMVQKVAVGIDRKGVMRVQLSDVTSPEDTLPLTKSLMNGARKEFPGKAITVSIFDPQDEPILKAHFQPGEGVRYQVVHGGETSAESKAKSVRPPEKADVPLSKSGTTEKDRKFAEWAMTKGENYLRYVQADLDRRQRLWFGVTRAVEPKDVTELTTSLLQGARTEFPNQELTATVFDPEGERIGKAILDLRGKVHWSK